MATLPELTRKIDNKFMEIWYEIRPEAVDNILTSNVLLMALRDHGCLASQNGGQFVTRPVSYGKKSKQNFERGTVLTQSIQETRTMARWDWRNFGIDINRTEIDDRENSGEFKIIDYVAERLNTAKKSLEQDIETDLFRWGEYNAAPKNMNGLYDIVAPVTQKATSGTGSASDSQNGNSGTPGAGSSGDSSNGKIDRINTWWRNWASDDAADKTADSHDYKYAADPASPYDLNLLPDMRHFFNLINANQEAPNFIITEQDIFEAYEDEVADRQQIVRTGFNKKAADLGFETLTFKGQPFTYSAKLAGQKEIFFLNLNHIEMVYHPDMWFSMTNWKETANQLERVAYILCMTTGLMTDQPRRHGVMKYSS